QFQYGNSWEEAYVISLRNLLFVCILGLPLASFASSTSCADPSGRWIYRTSTYEGGAPPPPFLVTYHRYWGFNGQEVEKQEGSQLKPAAAADVLDNIQDGTATLLESHGNGARGGKTFALLVNLERKSGNPLVPGQEAKKVSIYMICASAWDYMR